MSSRETWGYASWGGEYPASSSFDTSPAITPLRFNAEGQAIVTPSFNSANGSGDGKWRELYKDAIFEEGPLVWPERAEVAEAAIRDRVLELGPADSGEDSDARERRELHSALYFIALLRSLQAGRNAAG